MKLQCFSKIGFDVFILIKEGGVHTTQNLSSTLQDSAHQAIFHLDHVTSTQMGTYRCYSAFRNDTYGWSLPSDRLQLVVKGEEAHLSPCPLLEMTKSTESYKWEREDSRVERWCQFHLLRPEL